MLVFAFDLAVEKLSFARTRHEAAVHLRRDSVINIMGAVFEDHKHGAALRMVADRLDVSRFNRRHRHLRMPASFVMGIM